MILTRRSALIGALPGVMTALAGCGFHPLYAPTSNGVAVGKELQSIYVAVMAERTGQLLREALQRRFEGTGAGVAKKYELTGSLGIAAEAIGLQPDSSANRVRLTGNAPWTLKTLGPQETVLTQGNARAIDGVNINANELFGQQMESEVAQRRIAETIADQITLRVATFLRRRAEQPA